MSFRWSALEGIAVVEGHGSKGPVLTPTGRSRKTKEARRWPYKGVPNKANELWQNKVGVIGKAPLDIMLADL